MRTFSGTALHAACKKNNKEIVELLLKKNPDLQFIYKNYVFVFYSILNENGLTPAELATDDEII